jgi:cephalosporin hydroxylase
VGNGWPTPSWTGLDRIGNRVYDTGTTTTNRIQNRDLGAVSAPVQQFTCEAHRRIYEATKDIPGWQTEGDAFKLFELGYYAGDVILEVGLYSGRSAVVEIRGALANPIRRLPQFFGLDVDRDALVRTHRTLTEFGLAEQTLLYLGNLQAFVEELTVGPTMVFLDADHSYDAVRSDLESLSSTLTVGVPVLCHDYTNVENDTGEMGVRRAVTEWVDAGYAASLGVFGCSVLLLTTERCEGRRVRMDDTTFAAIHQKQLARYSLAI